MPRSLSTTQYSLFPTITLKHTIEDICYSLIVLIRAVLARYIYTYSSHSP
jgi:hypothetical protein